MLMQIDGTFIFVIISFLIFLFIIKSILYNPITKVIKERESFYEKNSKMELNSKEKTKALIEEKELLIKNSKKEAAELLKNVSKEAKKQSEDEILEAKKELQSSIEKNKEELKHQCINSKQEIIAEVNSIVGKIVSKILNKDTEVNLDEEKIKNYLKI